MTKCREDIEAYIAVLGILSGPRLHGYITVL